MSNNYILITGILILFGFTASAQNRANFTNFTTNKLSYNPAYAGSDELSVVTALYRHQWQGVEGAPRTLLINGHTPLFRDRVGLGAYIESDQIGMLNNFSARLSYAYRIRLSKTGRVAFGMQLQYDQRRLNWEHAEIFDVGDTDIPVGDAGRKGFNIGVGAYYHSHNFYAGLSVPNLLKDAFYSDNFYGFSSYKSFRTLYFMTGVLIPLSDKFILKPATLITYIPNAPFEADVNVNLIINKFLWIGGSYRLDDSASALIQVQVNRQLRIGGAYDFTLSQLQKNTTGTFEMSMKYLFDFENGKIENMRFF